MEFLQRWFGFLVNVILSAKRHVNLASILLLKIDKLVSECDNEMLNTTENSLDNKKATCEKK